MSGGSREGVSSFKEVQVERVKILPQAHADSSYTPESLKRIHFQIPPYANAFHDNSRSFLSFTAQTTMTGFNINDNVTFGNGLPIFNRMVVKSNTGLTLEDISQFHILTKLFTIVRQDEDFAVDRGIYGSSEAPKQVGAQLNTDGIKYCVQFNTGILSKNLDGYLPLFLMGGPSHTALSIELYLTPPTSCMRIVGDGQTTPTSISYSLKDVVWNACLLRIDESLCSKFNEIACGDEEVKIPFTTFHSHIQTLQSTTSHVMISEAGTNLKRIWTVYTGTSQAIGRNNVLPFMGSAKQALDKNKITKYNIKLGTKFLYNEPIQETINNSETLQYVKDCVWSQDKPLLLAKANADKTGTLFETADMFFHVANMCYSPEEARGVIQGVSSSLPIHIQTTFKSQPSGLYMNNFVELGYNLTIKNGIVSYEEQRPGSNSTY